VKPARCPKCEAELPRRGRFCLECGCDLYAEGVRRPPPPLVPIALIALAVGIVAVLAVLASRRTHSPGCGDRRCPGSPRLEKKH